MMSVVPLKRALTKPKEEARFFHFSSFLSLKQMCWSGVLEVVDDQ